MNESMEGFPTISRLPGSDVPGVEDYDQGEIAGMRSASWILFVTAGVTVVLWVVRPSGFPPVTTLVDLFLAVQLRNLKHSWRVWVLLRAGVGAVIGLAMTAGGLVTPGGAVVALVGAGQVAYCGSLFVLLFKTPSLKRVAAGRVLFGVSIVLTVVAIVALVGVLSHVLDVDVPATQVRQMIRKS